MLRINQICVESISEVSHGELTLKTALLDEISKAHKCQELISFKESDKNQVYRL